LAPGHTNPARRGSRVLSPKKREASHAGLPPTPRARRTPIAQYRRFGRIADIAQIGSKVRSRRQADIADRGLRHLNWADFALLGDSAGTLRGLAKRPSLYPLGAALVELVRGLLQDILQILVELPSNDIDSFIAKLSEGRNRSIVFKCNAILGTFQKQDPNGGVESG